MIIRMILLILAKYLVFKYTKMVTSDIKNLLNKINNWQDIKITDYRVHNDYKVNSQHFMVKILESGTKIEYEYLGAHKGKHKRRLIKIE